MRDRSDHERFISNKRNGHAREIKNARIICGDFAAAAAATTYGIITCYSSYTGRDCGQAAKGGKFFKKKSPWMKK